MPTARQPREVTNPKKSRVRKSPEPDVVPEAAPYGQEGDPSAGLKTSGPKKARRKKKMTRPLH